MRLVSIGWALIGAVLAAALGVCVDASAQNPVAAPVEISPQAPAKPASGPTMVSDEELTEIFSAFCLDAFPAAAGLDAAASAHKGVAMTADELKSLLHDDPGRGWMIRTSQALYGVTIEYPPFNGCAVRRMTPNGVSGVQHYIAAVKKYVAAKKGTLVNLPVQKSSPQGVDISMFGQGMVDASGQPAENFIVILSNYHGRAGGVWRPDAGTGVGVEVRFVRQLVKQ